ncbi:MAG: SRPBCC family protein [Candidatus Velamenicoccus archaeovorus]
MRVTVETLLPVPPDVAWPRLLAWEEQARWMRDADEVRVLTRRREGVGVRVAVRTRVLNVPVFTDQLEVTVWDPPRRLVMAHRSPVRGVGEWRLDAAGPGARFRWTEELSLPPPVLGELALRAYRPFLRHVMGGAVAELRELLERPGSSPA